MMNKGIAAALAAWMIVSGALAEEARGPVTNLPMPRFVSMKATEGNVRRGPSLTHRIDWVYRRKDLPLLITAEYGHWRRVEDREGQGGWVHYSLLSGVRTIMVDVDSVTLRALPDAGAPEVAVLRRGVVARIDECSQGWCRLRKNGYRGWTQVAGLWGVEPGEIIE